MVKDSLLSARQVDERATGEDERTIRKGGRIRYIILGLSSARDKGIVFTRWTVLYTVKCNDELHDCKTEPKRI